MKLSNTFLFLIFLIYSNVFSQNTFNSEKIKKMIAENFDFAQKQYQYLEKSCPVDSMPRSFINNKTINSDAYWWCSGFYPGSLLYIYEYTKSKYILDLAKKRLKILEPVKTFTGNHDLGFMMYCSYGNAYRLTQNSSYKEIILESANSLSTRYRPNAKVIQSWETTDGGLKQKKGFLGPVIIDNMMNLEMLEWASQNGGDKKFNTIAINHSDTTIKNHFRKNFSCFHVIDYNLKNGTVNKKITAQGAFDESAWSRGQGWALYGYTMMYRFTKNPKYIKQAQGVAKFILNNPNLPKDMIPYWDFDAPKITKGDTIILRDASAAAIYASAFLELGQYTKGNEKKLYINSAAKILEELSSSKYRAKLGTNGGYILMHSVGSIPHNSEIDVPLTYADYYFLEALLRFKNWYI